MTARILAGGGLLMLSLAATAAERALQPGDRAPAFEAVTDAGEMVALADFRGKTVVLYFYPKDDTPGCTAEACAFRDGIDDFTRRGAVILGVSVDGPESHAAFKAKHALPFTLLADEDAAISRAYGVYGGGRAARWTFVIDPKGRIKNIFPNVRVDGHAVEVLEAL